MEIEKVKEIKEALEDNKTDQLPYIDGWKCKYVECADILTLINELEQTNETLKNELSTYAKTLGQFGYNDIKECEKLEKRIVELERENERLENENYKLEQNLGQCENGYELELHTARCQVHFMEATVEKLKKENEILRNAKVVYETVDYCAEDLRKAQERIAELEQENSELKQHTTEVEKGIINIARERNKKEELASKFIDSYNDSLKQFAERLKEKLEECSPFVGYDLEDLELDGETIQGCIDETLKEFIK